jgi:hypothetical protein
MARNSAGSCDVIASVVLGGHQETDVRLFGRTDGWESPYLSVRIGQVLLRFQDQWALGDLSRAITQAETLVETTHGSLPPYGRGAPQQPVRRAAPHSPRTYR